MSRRPLRIANCSGFLGDRQAAALEMVEGGPVDVLTGDWLAELTMLILARQRLKYGPGSGWARPFLAQLEQVLDHCLDRGIKVVSNAGGLDPQGCASAVAELAERLGRQVRIAVVTGDDLMGTPVLAESPLMNLDTGERLSDLGLQPLTANAYLGSDGIAAALAAGADVVVTGRCTDAALVVGPAAWWHGWTFGQHWDALAGAVLAGHVIECGAQATGGNYAFFTDVPGAEHVGFPIAEVAADGSSVITKHEGTGGLVSVGTVTAQLVYEIAGPAYRTPDVVAHFDTAVVEQVGRDRVRISGVNGTPPPEDLKVSVTALAGFRNSVSVVLTGLDIRAKADLALRTVLGITLEQAENSASPVELAAASTLAVRELDVQLLRHDRDDPATTDEAQAQLRVVVKDSDPKSVGKPFTTRWVESALAGYPGMFPTAPPTQGAPYGLFWPVAVPRNDVAVSVTLDGVPVVLGSAPRDESPAETPAQPASPAELAAGVPAEFSETRDGSTTRVPFGRVAGARSGDKGGSANVGLWIPDPAEPRAVALAWSRTDATLVPLVATEPDTAAAWAADTVLAADEHSIARVAAAYDWLRALVTPDWIHHMLPETEGLRVEVHALPLLRAVNVVIHGLLGRGVAESHRLDPQAKGLGEHLRARLVDVPTALLADRR